MTNPEFAACSTRRGSAARAGLLAVVGACACLATGSASAAKFDFSYTFDTGDTVTGSFTGTLSGNDVTGLSNVTASFDGAPFAGSGSLNMYAYTSAGSKCGSCYASSGAVASFDPDKNNFFLTDASLSSVQDGAASQYFYLIPWPNGAATEATQYNGPTGLVDSYNGDFIEGNWSLTAASVPEPSAWVLMLVGIGAMGGALRSVRRTIFG
ncbi:MAG: PEP-CTERM sorting domain-containing protein [Caulobacteraceae bacterium]|nr:PEP-CTERM sorting domain-containing protein [Caulobacteraceae bacterium]